ncbi:hypothetical protein L1887_22143 [Cichorium endivia]|nr:hypothetical protein L1887_22143 [Cichorium endivia]
MKKELNTLFGLSPATRQPINCKAPLPLFATLLRTLSAVLHSPVTSLTLKAVTVSGSSRYHGPLPLALTLKLLHPQTLNFSAVAVESFTSPNNGGGESLREQRPNPNRTNRGPLSHPGSRSRLRPRTPCHLRRHGGSNHRP